MEKRRYEIRQCMKMKLSNPQILEHLKSKDMEIGERQLQRDIANIKDSAQKWMDSQAKIGFLDDYRLAIEVLDRCQQQLSGVMAKAKDDRVKVECIMSIAQLEIYRIELLAKGPLVDSVRRKVREAENRISKAQL